MLLHAHYVTDLHRLAGAFLKYILCSRVLRVYIYHARFQQQRRLMSLYARL